MYIEKIIRIFEYACRSLPLSIPKCIWYWYTYVHTYVHIFITKAIKNVNLERKRIHNIISTFFSRMDSIGRILLERYILILTTLLLMLLLLLFIYEDDFILLYYSPTAGSLYRRTVLFVYTQTQFQAARR